MTMMLIIILCSSNVDKGQWNQEDALHWMKSFIESYRLSTEAHLMQF